MRVKQITSAHNELLKNIRLLHDRQAREKQGLFLLEGEKLLAEAFAKGVEVKDVVVSQSFWEKGDGTALPGEVSEITVVEDKLFKPLVTTTGPCPLIATARIPESDLTDILQAPESLVVVLDSIQDPGNLGTMVRTALAASCSGIIMSKGTCDPYNSKCVRGAMGALFALPFVHDIELGFAINCLKENGFKLVACDQNAAKPFWKADLTGKVALIFGNEGRGLSSQAMNAADELVAIPMNQDSESLNVAISCAIVLFGAVEQRLG